jgi:hypothetical protein
VNGFSINLFLTGDAYPNVPTMTFTGGSWANGKYVVDPAQPVTITTNAFTAYGGKADDRIVLVALVPGVSLPFQQISPWDCSWAQVCHYFSTSPGNTATLTIPANTLVAGQEYPVLANFTKVVDRYNPGTTGTKNLAYYEQYTHAVLKAATPPFPMTTNVSIGPTVSSASANIQFRPQDVGTTGSVYTFFVAPSTKVLNAAAERGAWLGHVPKNAKDGSVQCVLAQLNASGQLQAVSTSSLQAYVTGVLSGQGAGRDIDEQCPYREHRRRRALRRLWPGRAQDDDGGIESPRGDGARAACNAIPRRRNSDGGGIRRKAGGAIRSRCRATTWCSPRTCTT